MVRCFVAVDVRLEAEFEQAYRRLISELSSPGVKPVDPKNLHLTLKFIGEVDDVRLNRIREALRGVRHEPFSMALRGLGAFPSPRSPRVIWIGVDEGAEELRRLRDDVEDALSGIVPREREGFVAHLTVARLKERAKVPLQVFAEMGDQDFGTLEVREFKLKRSVLTPSGPIYYDIEVYGLGGGKGEGNSGEAEG